MWLSWPAPPGTTEIMKTFREDPLPRSGKRVDPSVSQPAQLARPTSTLAWRAGLQTPAALGKPFAC